MQNFLYMPRRDRKGMILVMVFDGEKVTRTSVKNFAIIGLNSEKTKTLEDFYKPYRMNYDFVIESAVDFDTLKKRLLEKGFRNLPITNRPVFSNWQKENPKNFLQSQKIMLQKKNLFDIK